MVETIQDTWREYSSFYLSYLSKRWDNISPMEYGIVLVSIAVVGWLLMRSGAKKAWTFDSANHADAPLTDNVTPVRGEKTCLRIPLAPIPEIIKISPPAAGDEFSGGSPDRLFFLFFEKRGNSQACECRWILQPAASSEQFRFNTCVSVNFLFWFNSPIDECIDDAYNEVSILSFQIPSEDPKT